MTYGAPTDEVKKLLGLMEAELRRIGAPPMKQDLAFLQFQIKQGEALVQLETDFRKRLVAHRWGASIYRRFIEERSEISVLSARPYFRARQELFSAEIGPAIDAADVGRVSEHRINHRFVRWVLSDRLGKRLGRAFRDLEKEIIRKRRDMAILVLPLALSKVRVFWSRTPRSHHGYLDLLDVAVEGCMAAIDKFVPPFTRTFRAVIWGRVSTFLIDAYSQTTTHFYPGDRRMLYRANKLSREVAGQGLDALDYTELVRRIKKDAKAKSLAKGQKEERIDTTPEELASMMGAASSVSLDTGPSAVGRRVRSLQAEAESPEDLAVRSQAHAQVSALSEQLRSLVERKVLALLGFLTY